MAETMIDRSVKHHYLGFFVFPTALFDAKGLPGRNDRDPCEEYGLWSIKDRVRRFNHVLDEIVNAKINSTVS